MIVNDSSGENLLVGEVKWAAPREAGRIMNELQQKIERLPFVKGREVTPLLWLKDAPADLARTQVVTPHQVLDALR